MPTIPSFDGVGLLSIQDSPAAGMMYILDAKSLSMFDLPLGQRATWVRKRLQERVEQPPGFPSARKIAIWSWPGCAPDTAATEASLFLQVQRFGLMSTSLCAPHYSIDVDFGIERHNKFRDTVGFMS